MASMAAAATGPHASAEAPLPKRRRTGGDGAAWGQAAEAAAGTARGSVKRELHEEDVETGAGTVRSAEALRRAEGGGEGGQQRGSRKRRREEAQWKATENLAARLPWFVWQCQTFQCEHKTWSPARPCCLANGFLEPLGPPPPGGLSCYERLSREGRRRFRAWVQELDSSSVIQAGRGHFFKLLHPEHRAQQGRKGVHAPKSKHALTDPEMKAWPWMRDLDRRWFIGCGWVLTPEGPRRLVSSSCAPGTQIFQGCGQQVPSQSDQVPATQGTSAAAGAMLAGEAEVQVVTSTAELKDTEKKIRWVAARTSGVLGIVWRGTDNRWQLTWREAGRQKRKYIAVSNYLASTGGNFEAAVQRALEAAVAFRQDLVRQGLLKDEVKRPAHSSDCKGVAWEASRRRWRIRIPGVPLGCFLAKNDTPEEIKRTRLLAEEYARAHRQEEQLVVKAPKAAVIDPPKSSVPGVNWHRGQNRWDAKAKLKRGIVWRSFSPNTLEPADVEATRRKAEQWLLEQRRLDEASA